MAHNNVITYQEVVDVMFQCLHTCRYFSFIAICADCTGEGLLFLDPLKSAVHLVDQAIVSHFIRHNKDSEVMEKGDLDNLFMRS